MVLDNGAGHRHHPTATRPEPAAQFDRGAVEVVERDQAAGLVVRTPVDEETRLFNAGFCQSDTLRSMPAKAG